VGVKNNAVLMQTKGRYLKDFTAQEIADMRVYNKDDTDQCAALFKKLVRGFPRSELWQIHMTTEMLVNPQFVLDTSMVETALSMERDQKLKALLELDKLLHTTEERVARRLSDGPSAEEFVRSTLASAVKFGELLISRGVDVPMKQSPTNPGKMTPALAKTDEAFLALQEHPDPVVAAAATTRLAVKSTLLETRLEAFLAAAKACNGKLPVPLRYCGADTTGRWSGEQYNMQNLPRIDPKNPKVSDALRNALKAPPGHKVVVSDLSGIELRVNMFLWKVPYAMALFQADPEKADLYRYFAANSLYNVPEADITKNQRQLGKVCLAEDSLILSRVGKKVSWVKIQDYTPTMQLWDGKEWVWAQGVVSNGWKQTQQLCGLSLTPDHLVLCGTQWRQAQYVEGESLSQALATGAENLPLLAWFRALGAASLRSSLSATAGFLSTRLKATTTKTSKQLDATFAQSRRLVASVIGDTRKPCLKTTTAPDSSTDSQQPSQGVTAQRTRTTKTMGPAAFMSETSGAQTERRSYAMFAGLLAGTTQPLRWIGRTLTAATMRATSGLLPAERTCSTSAGLGTSNVELLSLKRVYDITNCGPRNRFTAMTDSGPIVVHNCHLGLGFGAGGATFQKVAKLMGGINMDLDEATRVVETYRAAHPEIPQGWRAFQDNLPNIRQGIESAIDPWGMCVTEKNAVRLPSGRRIYYPDLVRENDNGKHEWRYGQGRHRARIYAGKGVENLVQALARDVIADNALAFYKQTKLMPVSMVHDELIYIVKDEQAQDALDTLNGIMRTPPKWWPELVTWSEGDYNINYGLCK
jgi:hypothetical protein